MAKQARDNVIVNKCKNYDFQVQMMESHNFLLVHIDQLACQNENPRPVECVGFHGVYTPSRAKINGPVWHRQTQRWEKMYKGTSLFSISTIQIQ